MKSDASLPLKLGNLEISRGGPKTSTPMRMAGLLWGPAGSGKTAFAHTSPGEKLLLNLDPAGYATIAHRTDTHITHLDELTTDQLFNEMDQSNPLGLDKFLFEHPEIETVILDSTTALADHALRHSVAHGVGKGGKSGKGGFTPTMETPGIAAYGGRNANIMSVLTPLLRLTAKYNRHFWMTAHQDVAEMDEDTGAVKLITIMLSDKVINGVTWRISEIWHLSLDEKTGVRRLAFSPTRLRTPMKTRMFKWGLEKPEIILEYDDSLPDSKQAHTIANWYNQWRETGGKILIPQPAKRRK